MSLRWSGPTLDGFIDEFARSTTKTRRESKVEMRRGAKDIIEESKAGAPVDEHNLENAHSLETVRLSRDNLELEITIGGTHGGRDVDEYANQMHEGVYELGDKSKEKDRISPVPVGPGFLDRAVENHEDEIVNRLFNTLPGD